MKLWRRRTEEKAITTVTPDFAPAVTTSWPMATMSPALIEHIRLYGLGSTSYSAIYRSQPAVYTVVEFLAWQISQLGLKVFQRVSDTDRRELHDSDIARVLREPALGLTYPRFMHKTVADLGVWGNAYWLKLEEGSERSLVPLPVWAVSPRGGNIIEPAEYWVTTTSNPAVFSRDQIVHFRRYNPDDARIGVSPLEPLRRVLAEEAAAGAHREGFWRNAARMEGVLTVPDALTLEAYERLRESWQNTYSGAANAGKTAILEQGADFRPLSFSPKDAEFIAGRKLTLETVCRAFNVPVSVLGLTDTATFASQKEFHKSLYQDTLAPWLKMIEAEVLRGVVRWFTADDDVYVEFNIAEKLRGSFEEQADALRAWVGVPPMSINEWRARFNLPSIDEEWAELPVRPQNIDYVGGPGQAPMPETFEE